MPEPNSIATSILRHLGTIVAGFLIRKGYIDTSLTEAVVGIVLALGVLVLAYLNKRKAQQVKAATVLVAQEMPSTTTETQLNKVLAAQEPPLPPIDFSKATL